MAFRDLRMTDVKEGLRRWQAQAGRSARSIGRAGIVGRKTSGDTSPRPRSLESSGPLC